VRRLVDDQAGFDPASPVLITPIYAALFTGLAFLEYWLRLRPAYLGGFLVILLASVRRFARRAAGSRDRRRHRLPQVGRRAAARGLSSARRDRTPDERELVEQSLVWAGAFMGLYGVFQYINPQSWDLLWMRGVAELGMDSIGQPNRSRCASSAP
jgi:hypothetical protein